MSTWQRDIRHLDPRLRSDPFAALRHEPHRTVLRCGGAFDVINVPAMFGRRMLDRLWADGPGSGPVAVHRGRVLIFAAPGTAQRLPALLTWEEWGDAVPPLLCHGTGDAVTVPPVPAEDAYGDGGGPVAAPAISGDRDGDRGGSRWLVAPDLRHPWLPGTDALLWACGRAVRGGRPPTTRIAAAGHADSTAPPATAPTCTGAGH
ncbi:hypothetical protein [Streptomyces sp. KR80]|uniref:hypothetical protein n=1 Tax=Streptomyces sp. KR80 TaxID=3457426 RepID=UPI003FD22607